jgi:hypothetical protein
MGGKKNTVAAKTYIFWMARSKLKYTSFSRQFSNR